jgi:ABC-2 type transport system ATP-binding protein
MDPEARAIVRARIAAERAAGTAVLVTSHELADVERLADRIVILADGRVVGTGTPAELTSGLRPRLRFRLDLPLDAESVASLANAIDAGVRPLDDVARYEIEGAPPSPALIAALATWCANAGRLIVESRAVGGTLEDAYLELVAARGESA